MGDCSPQQAHGKIDRRQLEKQECRQSSRRSLIRINSSDFSLFPSFLSETLALFLLWRSHDTLYNPGFCLIYVALTIAGSTGYQQRTLTAHLHTTV